MQDNSFHSKYKYIKKLGQGGCGEVFLAENKVLGNLWAVKEIPKDQKTSISGYIEPEILKRLNHPALPRICDVYDTENKVYIVEDYLEGVCLKQELDKQGKFDEQKVLDWGMQLCNVLEYLHTQPNPIIYGDLKPHNIILTKEGFIKLIDFGVSMLVQNSDKQSKSQCETAFIGTKGYAAPEQFLGQQVSRASDIYSLGITLIQLITGLDPLKSISVYLHKNFGDSISPELYQILLKCIEEKPQMRFQSANILLKELQKCSSQIITGSDEDKNIHLKGISFSKVIGVTGAAGTGTSTIAAALAESAARCPTKVCIVSLNNTDNSEWIPGARLNPGVTIKLNKHLYYSNLVNHIESINSEQPLFYRQLSQMQDEFSHIFIDVDIMRLKQIEQYLNHIFIVSDMNPRNMLRLEKCIEAQELAFILKSRTSFIINKFYKGELNSRTILKGMLLEGSVSEQLQELIINAKIYEVPYDEKIYLKSMYSYYDESVKLENMLTRQLNQAVARIISGTLSKNTSKLHMVY